MTGIRELRSGSSAAVFDLDDGARLTGLRLGGHELIVPEGGQEPMWWGAFVMAPWTSVLRDPSWAGDAAEFGTLIEAGGDPAWHGVARTARWSARPDGAFEAALEGGWPFGGTVSLTPALAAAHLEIELSVTAGTQPMPCAVGWHPWFVRTLGGVEAELVVPQGALVQERDERGAPTGGWVDPAGTWNDCARTRGPVSLRHPGVGSIEVSYSGEFATLFDGHPQGVCIEPVSCPAERMDARLLPGESLSLTVRVAWRPE